MCRTCSGPTARPLPSLADGGVPERSNGAVLKTASSQGLVSSNLTSAASKSNGIPLYRAGSRHSERVALLTCERGARANGANDRIDRSATNSRVVSVFKQGRVCRAVRRLMNAVRREGGQSVLRSEPTRLLPKIGRQNKQRPRTETRKRLVLSKDGSQFGEIVTIGPQ